MQTSSPVECTSEPLVEPGVSPVIRIADSHHYPRRDRDGRASKILVLRVAMDQAGAERKKTMPVGACGRGLVRLNKD